ncbi:hypothetical protein [Algoriphagus sp.]|uniref:hypothetical protein n=1 Tax=Algoriphagus sp. TaxID=1872435 RepID=UPI00327A3BCD
MKNLYFILIFTFISCLTFAQTDSKFWIEVDGSYWQKGTPSNAFNSFPRERSGSMRPMIGFNFNEKWGAGLMMNFQSYRIGTEPLEYSYPIYDYNRPDDMGNYPLVGYSTTVNETSIQNDLRGFGLFLRRNVKLGAKTSLNFSFYGMKESGKDGNIALYPAYFPCPNCFTNHMNADLALSISYPSSITYPIAETNWKFGMDVAFAFQATSWMALEVRANLLEFRRQIIKDNSSQLIDPGFSPFPYYNIYEKMGRSEDFGSAVSRDGIRFGLVFSPF